MRRPYPSAAFPQLSGSPPPTDTTLFFLVVVLDYLLARNSWWKLPPALGKALLVKPSPCVCHQIPRIKDVLKK